MGEGREEETMVRLMMIADDLTGALDAGVQFTSYGIATRVVTTAAPYEDYLNTCEVLVVDAETRHLSPAQAYKIVHQIVARAVSLGIRSIFKKTDSALRGNVGAELTAVLDASKAGQLAFFPAFPKINRTTYQGVQYIDGTPVAQSIFGSDPFEPVRESRIDRLIHSQSPVPVCCRAAVRSGEDVDTQGIVVYDARTDEELMETAQALFSRGKLSVMAGCAGLGAVLPGLLGLTEKERKPLPVLAPQLLVICGSVNPITTAQLERAEQGGFLRIRLTPEQKLNGRYWRTPEGERTIGEIGRQLDCAQWCIIDVNDPARQPELEADAAQRRMDVNDVRRAVADSVGELFRQLIGSHTVGTLLITGGDTLRCCIDYIGLCEIEPLGELETGVVLSRFVYQGRAHHVITKSGGFGEETLLLEIAGALSKSALHGA